FAFLLWIGGLLTSPRRESHSAMAGDAASCGEHAGVLAVRELGGRKGMTSLQCSENYWARNPKGAKTAGEWPHAVSRSTAGTDSSMVPRNLDERVIHSPLTCVNTAGRRWGRRASRPCRSACGRGARDIAESARIDAL